MTGHVWERRFQAMSAVFSASVFILGCAVLVGWAFDIGVATSLVRSFAPMKVNSALAFATLGAALWLQRLPGLRAARARRLLGLVVMTLAALTLAEYAFGVDLGMDNLLIPDDTRAPFPGRMSVESSLMFVVLAATTLLGDGRWSSLARRVAGLVALSGSLVAIFGYLYGATSFYEMGIYTAVTVHTAIGLLLASCAVLLRSPDEGLTRLLASESEAGRLLRRLLPAIVLVPSVLGWLQLRGEDAGYFGQRLGEAIMTLATIASLAVFTSIIAASLHRSEVARATVQQRLEADVEAMRRMNAMASLFFPPSAPLAPVLEEVVAAAIAISGADFGNIQILDEQSHDLHIVAHRGFPGWWLEFWNHVSQGQGSCGTALARGERVIIEDVEQSPVFAGKPSLEMQRRAGVRAVQSTPLYTRSGEPIGMISTHFRTPHRPDDHTLRLLDLLGRQAADIIERARAEEQVRDLARTLETRVGERTREVQLLLKEIHHRVKNNLQVISSLFYLQSQQTTHAIVRKLLDESRGRLQSIALIHEKLYRSEQLSAINFGDYLRDLAGSLMTAIGVQAPHVVVHVDAEEVYLDLDRALPCALIVNELISNSLKHAFPGGRSGEVHVAVTRVDSELLLEVHDTGVGFPVDLDFRRATTLGLQLVTSLVKQLRGTVELAAGEGTTFRVHVPDLAAAPRTTEPVEYVH